MGTSISARAEDYNSSINVIPLVDIMLVLLIIFVITLPVMTHAVKLDLPDGRVVQPPAPPIAPITIEVQLDGSVSWNGAPVTAGELRSYVAAAASRRPQAEVRIAVDPRAEYDAAVGVLFAVQRGGMQRVGFVTTARGGF